MNSRRKFLKESMFFCVTTLGVALLNGCGSGTASKKDGKTTNNTPPINTRDSSAMTQADINKRKQLGYVDQTPMAEYHCSNCALFMPPKEGSKSGGCQLFKGPVNGNGYCTYWVAPQQ